MSFLGISFQVALVLWLRVMLVDSSDKRMYIQPGRCWWEVRNHTNAIVGDFGLITVEYDTFPPAVGQGFVELYGTLFKYERDFCECVAACEQLGITHIDTKERKPCVAVTMVTDHYSSEGSTSNFRGSCIGRAATPGVTAADVPNESGALQSHLYVLSAFLVDGCQETSADAYTTSTAVNDYHCGGLGSRASVLIAPSHWVLSAMFFIATIGIRRMNSCLC